MSKSYNTVCSRPESYNTVCPRPESCDTPRALMSITPSLCCDETEPRSIHSTDNSLLQGIFQTQGPNPGLPHCRQISYCLSHQGSPLLVTREMQIKTTMRRHLMTVRIAIMKKTRDNKCCWGNREKGNPMLCWWDCKLVQPLQKTVWHIRKLKIELPND